MQNMEKVNTISNVANRGVPRVLIGAPGSGSGKTTLVCGILQALLDRGLSLASFKCGPDYIDPMFHREVLGVDSTNLDLFLMGPETVRSILDRKEEGKDFSLIEGVMGYYDGIGGLSPSAGSYDLARQTSTPAVLVVDAKGKSLSLLAEIKGFLEFEPDSGIRAVIFNRMSSGLYPGIKEKLESSLPVKALGYIPENREWALESRHLGLVTAGEIRDIKSKLMALGRQCEETIDLDGLLELGRLTPALKSDNALNSSNQGQSKLGRVAQVESEQGEPKVRIGIAKDKAFCFYYDENLYMLEKLGADLVPFSPLADKELPNDIDGLYLGGGYPELYLRELSENASMLSIIRECLRSKMPTIAECGGFMYLHNHVEDKEGNSYALVGAIKGKSFYAGKLTRFGYVTLTAKEDNLLCLKGEELRGHEFHYWDSSDSGSSFRATKPLSHRGWDCVKGSNSLYAGYPHIHFASNPKATERFVEACRVYREIK